MADLSIRIDFGPDLRVGPGKIALLEHIAALGSISAGGRAMDMSYRRAWLLVDEVNRMFTSPVIETQLGGKGGGHAKLTEFGRMLVAHYREIEKESGAVFAERIASLEARLSTLAPQD